jgi:uncharacterized protein (TIGR00251 family)
MEPFAGAVQEDATGVILSLEVSPSRGKAGFSGYDPWRRSLRCAVRSPPTQGRANREVVEVIAGTFGIPAGSVRIISGATHSRKRVKIEGMRREAVLVLLGRASREGGQKT